MLRMRTDIRRTNHSSVTVRVRLLIPVAEPLALYGLAELFDTIGREVSTGQLDPRNPIRRSAVALAREFCRTIDATP